MTLVFFWLHISMYFTKLNFYLLFWFRMTRSLRALAFLAWFTVFWQHCFFTEIWGESHDLTSCLDTVINIFFFFLAWIQIWAVYHAVPRALIPSPLNIHCAALFAAFWVCFMRLQAPGFYVRIFARHCHIYICRALAVKLRSGFHFNHQTIR